MGGAGLQYCEPKLLISLGSSTEAPKVSPGDVSKRKAQVDAAKFALQRKGCGGLQGKSETSRAILRIQEDPHELQKDFTHLSEELKLTNDLGELGYNVHGARDGEIIDTAVRIRGVERPDESLILIRFLSTDAKKRMRKGENDPLPAENVANLK